MTRLQRNDYILIQNNEIIISLFFEKSYNELTLASILAKQVNIKSCSLKYLLSKNPQFLSNHNEITM